MPATSNRSRMWACMPMPVSTASTTMNTWTPTATAITPLMSGTEVGTSDRNAGNQQPLANVGVYAYASINGLDYNEYMDTDGNGHYAFNVGNGSWHLRSECRQPATARECGRVCLCQYQRPRLQ